MKIRLYLDKVPIDDVPPLKNAIPHAINKMTTVLMAVARSVFTPLIPTFAKIAVKAAKNAESNAYIHHIAKIYNSKYPYKIIITSY